jgi:hypothetical protein
VPSDVELIPDLSSSTGLAAAPASEGTAANGADSAVHFRTLLPNAVFVANRANRKREESADLAAQIDIGADYIEVEQRIDYTVQHESIQELVLEAAGELPVDEEGLRVSLLPSMSSNSESTQSGTPLRVEPLNDEVDFKLAGSHRMRVALPAPRIGKFTIAVRYRIPLFQVPTAGSTLTVPLVLPFDTQADAQSAVVVVQRNLLPSLSKNSDASTWKLAERQSRKNSFTSGVEFVAERPEPILPIAIGSVDSSGPSTTIVDRVWLQSWLAGGIEQDRAAFRLRTSGTQMTVELPPEATPGDVEVLVDGKPAEISARAAGRIVVRLGQASPTPTEEREPATHTLEVRFRRPIPQTLIGGHRMTPPRIDGTTELSQIYWQIVLPADEHIIRSPAQLVSSSQWQWFGSFWGRRPVMSQTDLEKWVGASAQQAPATGDSQYLYTGLLPVSSISFVTAPRWLIVLLASAVALVVIAGWFYLPIATNPWMLLAAIVVIVSAAVACPTAAVLIAQASAVGIVLGSLSVLISRLAARPGRRMLAPPITPSSQRAAPPRTDSIAVPAVMATASTAPTVTLRTSDSER